MFRYKQRVFFGVAFIFGVAFNSILVFLFISLSSVSRRRRLINPKKADKKNIQGEKLLHLLRDENKIPCSVKLRRFLSRNREKVLCVVLRKHLLLKEIGFFTTSITARIISLEKRSTTKDTVREIYANFTFA